MYQYAEPAAIYIISENGEQLRTRSQLAENSEEIFLSVNIHQQLTSRKQKELMSNIHSITDAGYNLKLAGVADDEGVEISRQL
jgi:hypothetical protein